MITLPEPTARQARWKEFLTSHTHPLSLLLFLLGLSVSVFEKWFWNILILSPTRGEVRPLPSRVEGF